MTGIGGDCFVLLKPKNSEEIVGLNGSGKSPKSLTSQKLTSKGLTVMPTDTADAVTIPGAIDAFCQLSEDYGNMSMAETLRPAIYYAETGVPVGNRTGFDWEKSEQNLKGVAKKFYLLNGQAPRPCLLYTSDAADE